MAQDTTWKSNKNTIYTTNKSQEVSPFPAGKHKAAMNRRESMRNTKHKNTNDPLFGVFESVCFRQVLHTSKGDYWNMQWFLFNYTLFQMGISLKRKNLLPKVFSAVPCSTGKQYLSIMWSPLNVYIFHTARAYCA